jgi:hypothetical protein
MKKRWYWIAPLAIVGIFLLAFIGGEVVMRLWNWLLPPLFGWRMLTFWQALGLLALCRVLFGGLGHAGRRGPHGRGLRRQCRNMTPEERERFRKAMDGSYSFGATGREGKA